MILTSMCHHQASKRLAVDASALQEQRLDARVGCYVADIDAVYDDGMCFVEHILVVRAALNLEVCEPVFAQRLKKRLVDDLFEERTKAGGGAKSDDAQAPRSWGASIFSHSAISKRS